MEQEGVRILSFEAASFLQVANFLGSKRIYMVEHGRRNSNQQQHDHIEDSLLLLLDELAA
jgi:hypothetical protein